MSNRLFQGIIHQLREAIDRPMGIVDEGGTIIACSELTKIGEVIKSVSSNGFTSLEPAVYDRCTFLGFGSLMHPEYAVFIDGEDEQAAKYANLIAVSLNNIKQYHDEKFDRSNFIKSVIMENILPGDIYLKAKELHFINETPRVVFLIRLQNGNDVPVMDILQSIFPDKNKDFVLGLNETDVVLVKEVKYTNTSTDLENLAISIIDVLTAQFQTQVTIGIGTVVPETRAIAASFKEAQVSLEIGKVFDTQRNIINYERLGIARLIYQLPTTLCGMFLDEIFKLDSIDSLDEETLFTILKFFENNLNVSETARRLFVHRNTLVYRLEKIKKMTGLDLREFDDAIVFKVALMVKKYLDESPVKY